MRVIGIGNWDRGDDAAGLLSARAARALGVDAIEFTADPLSLIDELSTSGPLVLIDAVTATREPGRIHWWNSRHLPREAPAFRSSTHGFSILDTIRLAQSTGRHPRTVLIAGIEAANFTPGAQPSPAIVEAANRLAATLLP